MPLPSRAVVIGASAGGIEPLRELTRGLPGGLDVAVLIVLHLPATSESVLPSLLRQGGLLSAHAVDNEPLEAGRIYVARPDHHLLVHPRTVRSIRGPRINGYRPSVDPLFRSAALSFGTAAIGVILSGALDDGASGLRAVKDHGGLAIVQDPADALYDGMPRAAIEATSVDAVVPLSSLVQTLLAFIDRPIAARVVPPVAAAIEDESFVGIAELSREMEHVEERSGKPSEFGCPLCGGVLWETEHAAMFACRVGHSFTSRTLAHAQSRNVDGALWNALRASEESAALCGRLRDAAARRGHTHSLNYFAERAAETERRAAVLRGLVRGNSDPGTLGEPHPDVTPHHDAAPHREATPLPDAMTSDAPTK